MTESTTCPSDHLSFALSTLNSVIENEFSCPICLQPITDPHVIPECLHRFCDGCIKQSIFKCKKQCPCCRARITSKRVLRKDQVFEELMNKVQIVIASLKLLELELKEKTSKLLELELKEEHITPPTENAQSTSSDSFDMSQFDPMHVPFVESILLMEKMNSLDNDNGMENAKDSENINKNHQECIVACRVIGAGLEIHNHLARAHIEQQGDDDAENDKECIGKVFVNHAQSAKECHDKHVHADSGKENVSAQTPMKKRKGLSQSKSKTKYGPDEKRKCASNHFEWANKSLDERCKDLLNYKEAFGDFDVPRSYDANPQLGIWVVNLRCRQKLLSPEIVEKLNEIGFQFHGPKHDSRFSPKFGDLIAFKEKYGHCDVPTDVELGK